MKGDMENDADEMTPEELAHWRHNYATAAGVIMARMDDLTWIAADAMGEIVQAIAPEIADAAEKAAKSDSDSIEVVLKLGTQEKAVLAVFRAMHAAMGEALAIPADERDIYREAGEQVRGLNIVTQGQETVNRVKAELKAKLGL